MPTRRLPSADVVRQSAAIAGMLAATARLRHEPNVSARFEQIAAEGEARARHLDDLVTAQAASACRRIVAGEAAGRELEGQ
jgi:hypothetical protein